MRCRRCGHRFEMHVDTRCRVVVLTGWDEKTQAFTGHRGCVCTGYAGPIKPAGKACPHEFSKENGNKCVHCGQVLTRS